MRLRPCAHRAAGRGSSAGLWAVEVSAVAATLVVAAAMLVAAVMLVVVDTLAADTGKF